MAHVIPLFALAACQAFEPGVKVLETRSTPPFSRIEVQGSTNLHVQVGAPLGLTVRAPEDSIAEVVTEVRGDTLVIRRADDASTWWDGGDVAVTVPSLEELHLSGSADAAIEGPDGGRLVVSISGSGDVEARGRVDRVEASVTGSGDLDLGGLVADEALVTVDGSGDAVVWAESLVEVYITGSGKVRVRGRPSVSRVVTDGSGRVVED